PHSPTRDPPQRRPPYFSEPASDRLPVHRHEHEAPRSKSDLGGYELHNRSGSVPAPSLHSPRRRPHPSRILSTRPPGPRSPPGRGSLPDISSLAAPLALASPAPVSSGVAAGASSSRFCGRRRIDRCFSENVTAVPIYLPAPYGERGPRETAGSSVFANRSREPPAAPVPGLPQSARP